MNKAEKYLENEEFKMSLDMAANDYASENMQHDLSSQYSAFIAGGLFMVEKLNTKNNQNKSVVASSNDFKLNSPSKYSLKECLEELKFGRTSSDQRLIDKFILQIEIRGKGKKIHFHTPFRLTNEGNFHISFFGFSIGKRGFNVHILGFSIGLSY
jgi:hypothetical protein